MASLSSCSIGCTHNRAYQGEGGREGRREDEGSGGGVGERERGRTEVDGGSRKEVDGEREGGRKEVEGGSGGRSQAKRTPHTVTHTHTHTHTHTLRLLRNF